MSTWEIPYRGYDFAVSAVVDRPPLTIESETAERALEVAKQIKPAVKEFGTPRNITVVQDEAKRQRRVEQGQKRIAGLTPEDVDIELAEYLHTLQDNDLKLRFSWPTDVDEVVRARFAELELLFPEDARPINSGAYGSINVMYSLSTEVSFPLPADLGILPEGGRISVDGNRFEISRVTFSLGLVKAGFPINVYTR